MIFLYAHVKMCPFFHQIDQSTATRTPRLGINENYLLDITY